MSASALSWAWKQKTGSPVAKFVLFILGDNANDDGLTRASVDDISRVTELPPENVRKCLQTLEQKGLLRPAPEMDEELPHEGQNWFELNVYGGGA